MSLAAVPGRRHKILEIAEEVERRGFPGIYGPSLGDSLSLCTAIAMVTSEIKLGTSIVGFPEQLSNSLYKSAKKSTNRI